MPRRSRNSQQMRVRRDYPVYTAVITSQSNFELVGTRLLSVKGANSEAPNYTFRISAQVKSSGTPSYSGSSSITYTGMVNGTTVRVAHDFPMPVMNTGTVGSDPSTAGGLYYIITPGANTSLLVYYTSGDSALDALPPSCSELPEVLTAEPVCRPATRHQGSSLVLHLSKK